MKEENVIINRFREAREMAGLSLSQAAKKLGLSLEYLLEIENCDEELPRKTVQKLAIFYEVNLEWLQGKTSNELTIYDGDWQVAPRELEKIKLDELPKLLRILTAVKVKRKIND